jgi:hypothetical protein
MTVPGVAVGSADRQPLQLAALDVEDVGSGLGGNGGGVVELVAEPADPVRQNLGFATT